MVQLINPANVEGNNQQMNDYSPIPDGKYPMQIVESEFKKTKAGNGHYLKLKHVIIDGEFKGRNLWNNLNLDNPNPTAVEIANKTLNTICVACGKAGVTDSAQLHGIPMTVTVAMKPATKTQPASNDIKYYEKFDGTVTPDTPPNGDVQESTPVTSQATADTGAKKKLPWEK